jgi:hypothetical protein
MTSPADFLILHFRIPVRLRHTCSEYAHFPENIFSAIHHTLMVSLCYTMYAQGETVQLIQLLSARQNSPCLIDASRSWAARCGTTPLTSMSCDSRHISVVLALQKSVGVAVDDPVLLVRLLGCQAPRSRAGDDVWCSPSAETARLGKLPEAPPEYYPFFQNSCILFWPVKATTRFTPGANASFRTSRGDA